VSAAPGPDGTTCFSVADNGIGIDPEHAERIFRPFYRGTPEEHEGTGIGLAVCEAIVQRHSGRIWAEPGASEGCVISFCLPARGSKD
jgi:signal transduction histidine kinase